jgi:hypothetical protein
MITEIPSGVRVVHEVMEFHGWLLYQLTEEMSCNHQAGGAK